MSKKKEKDHGYDDGSYVIKKSRKSSIFAFILCLLIAFFVWLYATNKEQQRMAAGEHPSQETLCATVVCDAPMGESL